MKIQVWFKSFFSDWKRIAAAILGFGTGLSLFFDASSLFILLLGALTISFIFLDLVCILQLAYADETRRFLVAVFLLFAVPGLIIIPLSAMVGPGFCDMAVSSVDYNTLSGECEVNTYSCDIDRPWYKHECAQEDLKEFCEREDFQANLSQREAIAEYGRDVQIYSQCKEAGYLE